ncbi:MAG: hypothetical protein U1F00_15680 [Rhodoferax sp.]
MKLAGLCLALWLSLAGVGARAADASALIRELSVQKITDKAFKLAFWLPPEFFLNLSQKMSPAQVRQLQTMLMGHAVFFVAEGEMGLVGMGGFKTRTDLLQSTSLVVNDGARISPAPDSAIHPDLRMFLEMMKPVMKGQLGNFGDAMEAIVFRIPLTAGQDILLSGGSKGRIRIAISGEEFAWRLPLGSLLPPAMDSETGEQFPGNFLFNPFTGRKLVVR